MSAIISGVRCSSQYALNAGDPAVKNGRVGVRAALQQQARHHDALQHHGLKQRAAGGPGLLCHMTDLDALVRIETQVEQAAQSLGLVALDGGLQYAFALQILLGKFLQIVPPAQARGGERGELRSVFQEKFRGALELWVSKTHSPPQPAAAKSSGVQPCGDGGRKVAPWKSVSFGFVDVRAVIEQPTS